MRFLLSLLAVAVLLSAHPARAQTEYPWHDFQHRGTLFATGAYAWHSGEETNLPNVRKEFQAGLAGAYNLVPDLSLTAYAVRGFENRLWRASIGPRLTAWKSADNRQGAAVGLAYAFHAGPEEELPKFRHEWECQALWGYLFSPRVTLGASTAYGLDNQTFRSTVGVAYNLTGSN